MEEIKLNFEKDGYATIPPEIFRLDDVTINVLRQELDNLFSGKYETGIYPDEIHWRQGISKDNVTREICNGWKSNYTIQKMVCSQQLAKMAATIMDWNVVRIGQDDIIYKPSSSSAVSFHQDGTYISDNFIPQDNNCITMWIALDDTDEENGALQYVPGSHRWPYTTANNVTTSSFHDVDEDNSEGRNDWQYLLPVKRVMHHQFNLNTEDVEKLIKTIPVRAGEMVVHHQSTWHGSGPNRSKTRLRRALVAHLLNGEVEWRTEPCLPHYIYGRYYIRGERIPREDFFPILHSAKPGILRTSWLPQEDDI